MTASPACLSRQVGDFLPPAGGVPGWLPADLAVAVPSGGACLLCRLLPPAFSLLSCPLSPQPALAERSSPAGKGETKSLFRRGLRPRHPCTEPLAALTEPASAVPGGGLPGWSPARPAVAVPGGGLTFFVAGSTCRRCARRGLARLVTRLTLPPLYPAGGVPALSPVAPCL